jgi:REP element-mobilizing transposase RayT
MTYSYRVHYFHLIWSTKNQTPWIEGEMKERLYSYLGGITKHQKGKLMEIGGMPDHIHMLIELSLLDKFSFFIRDLKSRSSVWVHKNFPEKQEFLWQDGYASFSVSFSALERVRDYIRNQEKHHAHESFDQEYLNFLNHHNIRYDERFVLG